MSETIISARGVGKKYRLGATFRNYALRDDIADGIKRLFGSSTTPKQRPQDFWALKDVNLDVAEGEVLGIIGANGAGKSTLLRVLSQITDPSEGEIRIRGRIGSLLEVGTGFHHELTGRENVFLNGAILGMSRKEIKKKFDEIIAFAEVEDFVDTPVKRYSSGMFVRLAFAVAAHLEPEILLIDEVLAVGDIQFQKKCLGKMGDMAKGGRTVLFVSHNMGAISRLCSRTICIDHGRVVDEGDSDSVIAGYVERNIHSTSTAELDADADKPMRLRKIASLNAGGEPSGRLEAGEPITIEVEYDINRPVTGAHVLCYVHNVEGTIVFGSGDADCNPERLDCREAGRYRGRFDIPAFLLGTGQYTVTASLSVPFVQVFDRHLSILSFEVFDTTSKRRQWQHKRRPGILGLELPWTMDKTD